MLHDIGKAVDHEVEGPHVAIGVDLAKNTVKHPRLFTLLLPTMVTKNPQTIIAVLVQAADAVSAARPGARRETLKPILNVLPSLKKLPAPLKESTSLMQSRLDGKSGLWLSPTR